MPPEPIPYVRVAAVADVPPGTVKMVHVGARQFALANVDGAFFALDNNCPHNGGPLGKGRLLGTEIECPWHQWRWDVRSGRCTSAVTPWRVPRIPVVIKDQDILLPDLS